MTIRYERVEMTPERAANLLEGRPANRLVNELSWRRLAYQMSNGLWVENGDTVRISESGGLVDGQHRLLAVVASGATVPMTLAIGVPDAAMTTMDVGRSRSLADIIKIAHPEVPQVATVAGASRILQMWDLGARGVDLRSGARNGIRVQQNATTTMRYFEEHEAEIREAVRRVDQYVRAGVRVPRAVLVALIVLTERSSMDDAAFFWDKMKTGTNLPEGSPMLALRSKISSRSRDETWQVDYWMALFIKAWNKYRNGEEWMVARFRRGGASPETFPEII